MLGDDWIANLRQTPGYGRPTAAVPCLLTDGCVWSEAWKRPMLAEDRSRVPPSIVSADPITRMIHRGHDRQAPTLNGK